MPRLRSALICVGTGLLAVLVPEGICAERDLPYFVGINGGWVQNVSEPVRLQWAFDMGATMPRIGVRMDLYQPYPDHADAAVTKFCQAGRSGLAFLFNGGGEVKLPDGTTKTVDEKVPENLWAPVFTNGTDTPAPGAELNPKNEWAFFVGNIVERYDGDGNKDAAGSPRLTYYSLYNEPDWMAWPEHPTDRSMKTLRNWLGHDFGDLARFAFVSWQAAKFADATCKVGVQLCFPSALGLLLDDEKHPLARNVDFVDFHAYAWPGSDTLVGGDGAMLGVLEGMRAEFVKRGLPQPDYICSEVGYQGDEAAGREYSQAVQRAAAAKVQVVAASLPDLVCAQWYGLFDPSYRSMGLIADVSGLPADGKGWQPKDAYYALMTAAKLLDPMSKGRMRFVEQVRSGEEARVFRFEREGQPLFVAWATDFKGEPERTAQVALPLPKGKYARYHWDFVLTGRPADQLEAAGQPVATTLGIDPVYFLRYEDGPMTTEAVQRPTAPPPPPWSASASAQDPQWPAARGLDGNFDTEWVGGWGSTQVWWQVEFEDAVTASSLRLKLGKLAAGISCVIQVSDDGQTWTTVSPSVTSSDWGTQTVRLTAEVHSRWWRLLFSLPSGQTNAALFEIEIGQQKGR